jgi:hypothetical protein
MYIVYVIDEINYLFNKSKKIKFCLHTEPKGIVSSQVPTIGTRLTRPP